MKNEMKTYKSSEGQTIFDICIIIYNNLDYLTKLMIDNNLNWFEKIPVGTEVIYDNLFDPSKKRITTNNYLWK